MQSPRSPADPTSPRRYLNTPGVKPRKNSSNVEPIHASITPQAGYKRDPPSSSAGSSRFSQPWKATNHPAMSGPFEPPRAPRADRMAASYQRPRSRSRSSSRYEHARPSDTSRGRSERRGTSRHRSHSQSSSHSSRDRSDSIASSRASPAPLATENDSAPTISAVKLESEDGVVPYPTPATATAPNHSSPPREPSPDMPSPTLTVAALPSPPATGSAATEMPIDVPPIEDLKPSSMKASKEQGDASTLKDDASSAGPSSPKAVVKMELLPVTLPDDPVSEDPDAPREPHFEHDFYRIVEKSEEMRAALRITIMTRILCDRQPREERVEPVLASEKARAELNKEHEPNGNTSVSLFEEVSGPDGIVASLMMRHTPELSAALATALATREAARLRKLQRLQDDDVMYTENWKEMCRNLDAQIRKQTLDLEAIMASSRTTRRTAATLGGEYVVRSDLEMEQIIANLDQIDTQDPSVMCTRNRATIPDMISSTRGCIPYLFDNDSLRVEDPQEYYRPETGMDDWSEEEERIFLERFASYPKQFGMIAEALAHKTAEQCVAFYYLQKNRRIDFRKVVADAAPKRRNKRTGKKKANALLADIAKHDEEVGALGGAGKEKKKRARRSQVEAAMAEMPPADLPDLDVDPVRPKRRRVVKPSDDVDDENDERPTKRRKSKGKPKSAAVVPDDVEPIDDEFERRKAEINMRWSQDDQRKFKTLFTQYGADFQRITAEMPSQVCALPALKICCSPYDADNGSGRGVLPSKR
ncbi:hypothetical protein CYLTODRAFT_90890 [Cylindrobasidium torrendii FP15055 ss-10]|uniref:SANT domain-containing protein n=1 Tax=Cylindrobasidium torrendii FP15055 ss-10 TaxID=1314674 RepID=A0A0D7BWK3_9AGAR|nr:hypothetical protein CYLTODRAFT_90890 [Cylindrobasidium torrendii FP15055 ss-10]